MSPLLTLVSPSGILDLALKGVAVTVLAALFVATLSRASAAWRHLVWSLSVACLLLLPVMSLTLPAWRVSWLPQWNAGQTALVVTVQAARSLADSSSPPAVDPAPTIGVPVSSSVETVARESLAPAATTADAAGPAPSAWPWFAMIWVLGGLLSLAPLMAGLWQLAIVKRRSRIIDDQRWLSLLDDLRRQAAVRRRVELRQSASSLMPLTWGALRPVLLVPAAAESWSDERRRLVLLHELAHIRRWDWLTQFVAHIACAVHWINPLVWLAATRMRIERERACDDLVLAAGAKGSDYARELLSLAAGMSASRLSTLVALPMARRGALEDRLRGILDVRRNRTASSMPAVVAGAALAAGLMVPLAMLQAAAPQSGRHVSAVQPAAGAAAPDQVARAGSGDQAGGITISVLNSNGDRDIPEFRVIAGVSSGGVASEYEMRTGRTVIIWQPHTCRVGKDGRYVWPLDKAYEEMALRVEADGYQPQTFMGIKKSDGAQEIAVRLSEDKGIAGRVLSPSGEPAAGATVALAIPSQENVWEDGKLRGTDEPIPDRPSDRWRRPRFFKTDASGGFRLPTEIEPAAVLVVHDTGVLEIAYDAWKEAPEIKLRNWGGLAGQCVWQDTPGADEEIGLTIHRDEYGYPGMVASYTKTRTDKEGRFTFDRVLPGLVQVSRATAVEPNDSGITDVVLDGMFRHVTVAPGDATPMLLGGRGRTVIGRFVGLDSWKGATFHVHPNAPHIGFPGDDEMWKAFGQLKASPIGPMLFRDRQPINPDGTFTIERMLPGRYQLFLSAPGFENYAASATVQIDPEVPGEEPAPVELKEIATRKEPAPPADNPADKRPEKPAAKAVTVHGQVVDDATGEPIEELITQGGKFDPADREKVTWGYSESRSSDRRGSFSTTVRWADGWTARILADGYIPQPVITSAPPADKDEIEVVIRLKRGPIVRGVVLDHAGNPVKGAAVMPIGPTGVSLPALESRFVPTGADGRFELPIGESKSLAVSHVRLEAWAAEIPASGEVTIHLPEPARVAVELDIEGAAAESVIFYQLLTQGRPEFRGVRLEREVKIANPGKLSLTALPPGRYQFCRSAMNRLEQIGVGAMLEREFFELKAGETKSIRLVRDKGARIRVKVNEPQGVALMGSIISVRSMVDQKSPFNDRDWPVVYASQVAADDGSFLTERLLPGKYLLVAERYTPLTDEQRFRTGFIVPSYRAQVTIEIPADGELKVDDLILAPSQAGE